MSDNLFENLNEAIVSVLKHADLNDTETLATVTNVLKEWYDFYLLVFVAQPDSGSTPQQAYDLLCKMAVREDWFECYRRYLSELSYKEYLDSAYWKITRRYVLELAGNKCALCSSTKRLNVHHKTYEHKTEEHLHLSDLIVLCNQCHGKFHDKLP